MEQSAKKGENVFADFYDAYHFLRCHEVFEGKYQEALDVEVVKVNPKTRCIDSDWSRNTMTQVWFEAGPPGCHDLDLDCGGATYEEATIKLANLMREKYGDAQVEPGVTVRRLIW